MHKLEQHNSQSYHYDFVGSTTFKTVYKKLSDSLPYYRVAKSSKNDTREIFYDIPKRLLSEAGIVISKFINGSEASLNVRKLSNVKTLKRRSTKYLFSECRVDDIPRDFSYELASLIESIFKNPFSVDTEALVKQTEAFLEIDIKAQKYDIICGSGYKAVMLYEDSIYKDLKTGKKIMRNGITFKFPVDDRPEREEVLRAVEKNIKGLAFQNDSRFELAEKLLYKTSTEPIELVDIDDEEGEDN